MRRFLALALVVFALAAVVAPTTAQAHSGKQSYLYLSIFDDGVEGRIEMPAVDLARALDIEIPQQVAAARTAVGRDPEPIIAYVADHLAISGGEGPWTLDLAERLRILPTENGPYVVLPFVVDEEFDAPPRDFVVDLSVIIESDPEKDALLIIEDDWATANFDNGSDPLLGFSTGLTEQRVALGGASTLDSMRAIRGIGTDALRTTIDALQIVVGLIAAAVMTPAIRRSRAVPAATVGRRLGTTLGVLVVGHSISLWVVGTGAVTPSVRVAGILTALGLLVSAAWVLLTWSRPARWSMVVPVVVTIGLLQGVGLGTYFDLQDLGRRRPIASLLAFQFGVEVAVLILSVLVAVPLFLLRRTRLAPAVTIGIGAILAGYAVAWLCERLLESDWPIEEVANPLRVWPRNLWFVALAIAVAAAVRWFDGRKNTLREIDESPTDAVSMPPAREMART